MRQGDNMVTQKEIDQWGKPSVGDRAYDLVSMYCLQNDLVLPDKLFQLVYRDMQDLLGCRRPEWISQEDWDKGRAEKNLLEKVEWYIKRQLNKGRA